MSYELPSGILSYCHGFWDGDTKQFEAGSSDQVVSCCLESCSDYINYCFSKCDQGDCKGKCDNLVKDCQDACLEYDLDFDLQKVPMYKSSQPKAKNKSKTTLYVGIVLFVLFAILLIKLKFF
jgi:hypothetical protein